MLVSEEIERLAVSHSSAADISKVAIDQGMKTLRDDGWLAGPSEAMLAFFTKIGLR